MDIKLKSILHRVIGLFKVHGLRGISMDEVSRQLGISKKTLYHYVVNKEDLITKCCEYINESYKCTEIEQNKNHNAIDVLLEISRSVRANVDDVSPVVIYDFQKYYPHVLNSVTVKRREMIYSNMCKNFERGIKEGIYRDDIEHDIILKLYVKNLMERQDTEFINEPLNKIFSVVFDSYIRLIVNANGLNYYEKKIKPQTTFTDL